MNYPKVCKLQLGTGNDLGTSYKQHGFGVERSKVKEQDHKCKNILNVIECMVSVSLQLYRVPTIKLLSVSILSPSISSLFQFSLKLKHITS